MRKIALLTFISLYCIYLPAQESKDTIQYNRNKLIAYSAIAGGTYLGSMYLLNDLWYKNSRRSNFEWVNDNPEWLQMDKLGHVSASYYLSYVSFKALEDAGLPKKKAIWYGVGASTFYLTSIEVFDGYSELWGASSGDIVANTFGSALFASQQLMWDEQRIQLKFSFMSSEYAQYRPNLLGDNFGSQVLKDYNGQTYWLSVNINSFMKESKLPKWLNIAIGYGGNGMVQGRDEVCNNCPSNLPHFDRYRQYYLSLDVDLRKIPTKSKTLKTIFEVVSYIKIPSPTLEFNKVEGIKFLPIYF